MDVILKQDVEKLGLRGELVSVARGYARNYLLPRGLAETATPGLVREIEKRDAQRARQEAKTVDEARAIASRLEALELRFDVNAGPTGTLFGSVTATNVADRLWEDEKIRVDRRKLGMDVIKRAGRYTVPVDVFGDVVAELKLAVAPAGQEPPENAPEPEPETPPTLAETEPLVEEPDAVGEGTILVDDGLAVEDGEEELGVADATELPLDEE
jgi:large subunit ribosomal protein L9